MLFHLLIVDDEPTIRKGLSCFMQWDSLECVVDDTACDGQEAIEMIQRCQPHIVITDVKMPQMDGISLAKYIYENYPKIKVIMLTGYAEFEYARSAIQYQVSDFIVKPTSKEKLMDAVKKCQTILLKDMKTSSMSQLDLFYLKEQLLSELTSHSEKYQDMEERLLEYHMKQEPYFLIVYQFEQEQFALFNENFMAITDILLKHGSDRHCFRYNNHFLIAIHPVKTVMQTLPNHLIPDCEETIQVAQKLYGIRLSAGISLCHPDYVNLPLAFSQAIAALNRNFYQDSCVCIYDTIQGDNSLEIEAAYLIPLNEIENALKEWDFELAEICITKLFAHLRVNFINAADIKNICTQIFYMCSNVLIKKELTPPPITILTEIRDAHSIFGLQTIAQHLLDYVQHTLPQNGMNLSPIIEQTITYINRNLGSPLSLEVLASFVHVHSSYLSRSFKKNYGISLTDYINKTRIEKAKELLSDSHALAYEVAETVGFRDPAYFSSIFKKYTGVSPSEYKKV